MTISMMAKLFNEGDYVVYPAHGVGRIVGHETQAIGDIEVQLLVVSFEKDRMILRLPLSKAKTAGLRPLSTSEDMKQALQMLTIRTKARRAMWSRRAQEYEAKINSGDPKSIAEVIRDLYRATTQSDQSYSERQIYQAALERFVRELAAVEKIDESSATQKLEGFLKAA
jgi:CarD family transcriptional regulator